MVVDTYTKKTAFIEGKYRYRLTREWDVDAGPMAWIMLNPSTADAMQDDPTIRRCVGFAKRWGFGGIDVVNLFALRATDPKELERVGFDEAVGPLNLDIIDRLTDYPLVVAAWGANRMAAHWDSRYHMWLPEKLMCLGKTKSGAPKHPLYIKADKELELW